MLQERGNVSESLKAALSADAGWSLRKAFFTTMIQICWGCSCFFLSFVFLEGNARQNMFKNVLLVVRHVVVGYQKYIVS